MSEEISRVEYLKLHFGSLSLEEKIACKEKGRPKPKLKGIYKRKGKSHRIENSFRTSLYNMNDWLCGCETTNCFYCFSCLLFGERSCWTHSGATSTSSLANSVNNHENTVNHLRCHLQTKLLRKEPIWHELENTYGIRQQNEQARKNRYVLSKIIDRIKCGAFEQADTDLIHLSALEESYQTMHDSLLHCVLQVARENIKKEMSKAKYISLMVNEISNEKDIYQLAMVFRYILVDGTPVERFWSFMQPPQRSASSLTKFIKTFLDELISKAQKLISQTYDGGSKPNVQEIKRNVFSRFAFYVHCYAHELKSILSKVAGEQNQEVQVFFSNLRDIAIIFSDPPQHSKVLNEDFKNNPVNMVYKYRELLIEIMDKIKATSEETILISQATTMHDTLQDSSFIFWLTLFYRIWSHVDALSDQETLTDPTEIHTAINNFETSIQTEKINIQATNIKDEEVPTKRCRLDNEDSPGKEENVSRIEAAQEICDIIIAYVKERFSFTQHLNASVLYDSNKFPEYQSNFPIEHLEATVAAYQFLDKAHLKTELELIYDTPGFRNMSGIVPLLKFIIENQLQKTFSATFALLQVLVTTPMVTNEVERIFSTFEIITTFFANSMGQEKMMDLALLSIERDFVRDLPGFNKQVIKKFSANKNRLRHFSIKPQNGTQTNFSA